MKYFGIGLHKTGTTTLGQYFEACGLRHHFGGSIRLTDAALRKDYRTIAQCVDRFDSFEDAPWFLLYPHLCATYPEAKFILTVRSSPQKWLQSVKKHVENYGVQYSFLQSYNCASPHQNEEHFLRIYQDHILSVESYFVDKPGKLLKICFEEPGAREQLLAFMGREDLDIPEIHANSGSQNGGFRIRARTTLFYWIRRVMSSLGFRVR